MSECIHFGKLTIEKATLERHTGIPMILDGDDGDPEFSCSLDRIDSSKHYERANLEAVCRFANRWKSDSGNDDFLRLIEAVISANAQFVA